MTKVSAKLLAVVLLSTICLSGCWNRRELDTLAIVAGLGIDVGQEPGTYEMTAQIVKPEELGKSQEGGSGGGQATSAVWNVQSSGRTVFEAARNFVSESSRKLYFPHNDVIVLGKAAAEQGVGPLLDFLVRDHEPRLTMRVLVAEETACDIMRAKLELSKVPALGIGDLVSAIGAQSIAPEVNLLQFLNKLLSKTAAPIAPMIAMREVDGKQVLHLEGTAVFSGDKLAGWFDRMETRGLLWVLAEVRSGILVVPCPESPQPLSLEIIRASSKISPQLVGDQLHIEVQVREEGNLGEQFCQESLVGSKQMDYLGEAAAQAIQAEMQAALRRARELNVDVFGFGEAIHRKYPKLWKELEPNWDQEFPTLDVRFVVEAKVRATGLSTKPLKPQD